MEEWRDVPGFEGRYQVSSLGRVKSFLSKHPKILKNILDKEKSGFKRYKVTLSNCEKKLKKIQREIVNPAIKAGKIVNIKEIPGTVSHTNLRSCKDINSKILYMKPSKCKGCSIHELHDDRIFSDTTMKIKIS